MAVVDELTKRAFLVDTGAEECVFPASYMDRKRQQQGSLRAANGSAIATFGKRYMTLRFSGKKFTQEFWIADVTQPILGADFFACNKLAVDLAGRRLIALDADYSICADSPARSAASVFGVHQEHTRFEAVLEDFPDLLVPKFNSPQNKHGVEHHIPTDGPPVFARARRLDPQRLEDAKAEFAEMERLGIVRRSDSPWSSPLHMVRKSDGSWRPCGDYRRLNDRTRHDRYPLPHIQDLNANLAGCTIFSKIDLVRGYNQIPVAPADVPKTAILTPFGLFEFLRMPFGLKNAAQAFQRLMDGILRGVDCCFVYLDDILVASRSAAEHENDLRTVFSLLAANGMAINHKKCVFGASSLEFLGHRVSATGVEPLPDKVKAIANFPTPTDKKELQRFLGMVNFYHRFLPRVARRLAPLTNALRGKSKKKLEWSEACDAAFTQAKSALASAVMLHHPQPAAETKLTLDASDIAIGAELAQRDASGQWKPIAFFSRKLTDRQRKYSAFGRELLAIHSSIRHFRYFLEGREFCVYTDHEPLTHTPASLVDRSPREERQLSYICEFTTDIRHIRGVDNVVADALSRAPLADDVGEHSPLDEPQVAAVTAVPEVDYAKMVAEQKSDPLVQRLVEDPGSLLLQHIAMGDHLVMCDTSSARPRPVVPPSMTKVVFDSVHALNHPAVKPCTRAITAKFVWPNMKRDIKQWCQACHDCSASKISKHTKAPLSSFDLPDRRFGDIHVDIVGPLPVSEGHNSVFTVIDRYSRWPEGIPMQNMQAPLVLEHFYVTGFRVMAYQIT